MKSRVVTPALRDRLTRLECLCLRAALRDIPDATEPPAVFLNGLRCHGTLPEKWVVALAMRLADFACQQLSRQEGFRIDFKAAILRTERENTLLWWGLQGELFACHLSVLPDENGPAGPSQMSSPVYPPILRIRETHLGLMSIPYSVSAGRMASRCGLLVIDQSGSIRDEVFMLS